VEFIPRYVQVNTLNAVCFLPPLGKRFNVLRNRIDNWDYETDQLLFGTILFTLLAFLFPTVLAYYALFAIVCVSIDSMGSATYTIYSCGLGRSS
jgi:hypothetical protein